MVKELLTRYGITNPAAISHFGNGLINSTWLVEATTGEKYIFQQVNTQVFKDPDAISSNVRLITQYLQQEYPSYLLPSPIHLQQGPDLIWEGENCYRLLPFVKNSHTVDVLKTPLQAYAAAKAFGKFTRLLSGFDPGLLQNTLPHFHDLNFRYGEFELALELARPGRKLMAEEAIKFVLNHSHVTARYNEILCDPRFKKRIIHHDTKISNVLFNPHDEVLCVIDLDTVMPGCFISDLGDMIRTYVCPVSEEERDFTKIVIRENYLHAVVSGYLSEMEAELSAAEKQSLIYSGRFMIYMQAMRFLTDYLNNDTYYGARYEEHNLMRALNQAVLYEKLEAVGDFLVV